MSRNHVLSDLAVIMMLLVVVVTAHGPVWAIWALAVLAAPCLIVAVITAKENRCSREP